MRLSCNLRPSSCWHGSRAASQTVHMATMNHSRFTTDLPRRVLSVPHFAALLIHCKHGHTASWRRQRSDPATCRPFEHVLAATRHCCFPCCNLLLLPLAAVLLLAVGTHGRRCCHHSASDWLLATGGGAATTTARANTTRRAHRGKRRRREHKFPIRTGAPPPNSCPSLRTPVAPRVRNTTRTPTCHHGKHPARGVSPNPQPGQITAPHSTSKFCQIRVFP